MAALDELGAGGGGFLNPGVEAGELGGADEGAEFGGFVGGIAADEAVGAIADASCAEPANA